MDFSEEMAGELYLIFKKRLLSDDDFKKELLEKFREQLTQEAISFEEELLKKMKESLKITDI